MADPPAGAGAAPQRVADLLRTFSAAPARRRRPAGRDRSTAPETILPLLVAPGHTPLDPSRIEAARARLKAEALSAQASTGAAAPPVPVDPSAFDAARTRLRRRAPRPRP